MNFGFVLTAAAALAAPPDAAESLDALVFDGQVIYGRCVVSEAVKLDDGRESASSLAEAGVTACSAAAAEMIKLLTTAIVARTPEIPRTIKSREQAAIVAAGSMESLSAQAKKLAVLEVLSRRSRARK